MSKQDVYKAMRTIDKGNRNYEESWHIAADDLLCEVLLSCGYDKLVDWFNKGPKWYS